MRDTGSTSNLKEHGAEKNGGNECENPKNCERCLLFSRLDDLVNVRLRIYQEKLSSSTQHDDKDDQLIKMMQFLENQRVGDLAAANKKVRESGDTRRKSLKIKELKDKEKRNLGYIKDLLGFLDIQKKEAGSKCRKLIGIIKSTEKDVERLQGQCEMLEEERNKIRSELDTTKINYAGKITECEIWRREATAMEKTCREQSQRILELESQLAAAEEKGKVGPKLQISSSQDPSHIRS